MGLGSVRGGVRECERWGWECERWIRECERWC